MNFGEHKVQQSDKSIRIIYYMLLFMVDNIFVINASTRLYIRVSNLKNDLITATKLISVV